MLFGVVSNQGFYSSVGWVQHPRDAWGCSSNMMATEYANRHGGSVVWINTSTWEWGYA
jgi:hypothetical protein